jgi:23S rRNA (guanine745-N1)-methyltransferase
VLADILAWLRCPVCAGGLESTPSALRCQRGHSFDVARQGYVNLLTGRAPRGADTAEMVAARAELLDRGFFRGVRAGIVAAIPPRNMALIVEVGAGTGHNLAAALDARPGSRGIALDVSTPAARRAARAHALLGVAVCDVWHGVPVADGCADVVLDVFAPRNPAEFHRVLRPDGMLVVAVPEPGHLRELIDPLGLLHVPADKEDRLRESLGPHFRPESRRVHRERTQLSPADALRVATMGPTAFHVAPELLAGRVAALPDPVEVTLAVAVHTFRPA